MGVVHRTLVADLCMTPLASIVVFVVVVIARASGRGVATPLSRLLFVSVASCDTLPHSLADVIGLARRAFVLRLMVVRALKSNIMQALLEGRLDP